MRRTSKSTTALSTALAAWSRIYKLDGPRGVFAELAGVNIEKVEIEDGEVTINE